MLVPIDLSKLSHAVKNDVVKSTDYNAKITEIENKIPDISNLASKTALATVANRECWFNLLSKKPRRDTKESKRLLWRW